jgi:hypothetical protein
MTSAAGTAVRVHPLHGLEPDNLLAFLALLGLLRALEASQPQWQPRVDWAGDSLTARLHLGSPVTSADIVAACDQGISLLHSAYVFNRLDPDYTAEQFRSAFHGSSGMERERLAAALGSDAGRQGNEKAEITSLCTMSGQGHQHFLERLNLAVKDPNGSVSARRTELARSLFSPWRYGGDPKLSFRWDPSEDRRYAYQYGNPSDSQNKIGSEAGACRLAAVGFTAFTSAPAVTGLRTIGGARHRLEICWPIVQVPTSLAGHVALLAHPWLVQPDLSPRLRAYGVRAIARSRRYTVGRFRSFERATIQPL